MSDEVFEKIIDDCSRFPLRMIEPFLNGEPFCDPKLLARLEHIRRRLPQTRLRLYTNGYALTPRRADDLAALGVDHLFVSLNTIDPQKYRSVVGLRLERVLDNLEHLASLRKRRPVANKMTYRMTRLPDTTLAEQRRFLALCRKHGTRPFIVGLYNYKGDVNSPLPVPNFPCANITRVDVLASGIVTLCCMDHEGEYAWGDVRKDSILGIYNGEIARRYRKMHRSGERYRCEPCDRCNVFSPSFAQLQLTELARSVAEYWHYRLKFRPHGMKRPVQGLANGSSSPSESSP